MITKISVDGFKSLMDFEFYLNQGLNILVGPNGAGKTNILLFFEFLSKLSSNPIGLAISSVGGAGSIFHKNNEDQYNNIIKSTVYGCSAIKKSKKITNKYLIFEYHFEIRISDEKDTIFFSKQEIKISTTNKFFKKPENILSDYNWGIHIKFDNNSLSTENNSQLEINLGNNDDEIFHDSILVKTGEPPSKNISLIAVMLSAFEPSQNSIIPHLITVTNMTSIVMNDLKGGETFNIIPSKVKEIEDTGTTPGINKDGKGLATTLYAMKKNISSNLSIQFLGLYSNYTLKHYKYETLDLIKSYLKIVNSSIDDLEIENDAFNNKLQVKVIINSGTYKSTLPLSAMSDGTIKWLALITAILTSETFFSLEEPENFLHPLMQSEILKIMRSQIQAKSTKSYILMTTHSESLLNEAKPEELLLVRLISGKTIVKNISNIKEIKKEIRNSGLGLGHFYRTNTIDTDG